MIIKNFEEIANENNYDVTAIAEADVNSVKDAEVMSITLEELLEYGYKLHIRVTVSTVEMEG